jgi:hypothetical protein
MGGNPTQLRAEPGKQRPRSCRTQELARSSGPRKCVAEKGWLTRLDKSQYDGRTTSRCETKKTVANVRARMLPVGRTAQKGRRDSIVSLGLDNPGRGEDPEERSARVEGRGRRPMEVADDGLEQRLRRLLPGGRQSDNYRWTMSQRRFAMLYGSSEGGGQRQANHNGVPNSPRGAAQSSSSGN